MSKISELSDGGSLQSTDYLIAVRSGGNVKVQADGNLTLGTLTLDGLTVDSGSASTTVAVFSSDLSNSWLNIQSGADSGVFLGSNSGTFRLLTSTTNRLAVATNGDISFYEDTGTTPKFFWDASAESLGLGTTSPNGLLETNSTGDNFTYLRSGDANTAGIIFGNQSDSATASIQMLHSDNSLSIRGYNNAEAMRIDSSGNVGIGTTNPVKPLHISQGANNTATTIRIENTDTTIETGQEVNSIEFYSNDASASGTGVSSKIAQVASNPGNQYDLAFYTYNTSLAEALRIKENGNVGIGESSPAEKLEVAGNILLNASNAEINLRSGVTGTIGAINWTFNTDTTDFTSIKLAYDDRNTTGLHIDSGYPIKIDASGIGTIFAQSGSEKARFDSSGNLLVGTTDSSPYIATEGAVVALNDGVRVAYIAAADSTASRSAMLFTNPNGQVGSIVLSASATAYNTSSDYRLKDVDGPITNSGAYIDALKPVQGSWKADGSRFIGLIAHEVQEVSETQIATGEKDGEEMQGMDYSAPELIANLIAEIQSLRARVAQLEGA